MTQISVIFLMISFSLKNRAQASRVFPFSFLFPILYFCCVLFSSATHLLCFPFISSFSLKFHPLSSRFVSFLFSASFKRISFSLYIRVSPCWRVLTREWREGKMWDRPLLPSLHSSSVQKIHHLHLPLEFSALYLLLHPRYFYRLWWFFLSF